METTCPLGFTTEPGKICRKEDVSGVCHASVPFLSFLLDDNTSFSMTTIIVLDG